MGATRQARPGPGTTPMQCPQGQAITTPPSSPPQRFSSLFQRFHRPISTDCQSPMIFCSEFQGFQRKDFTNVFSVFGGLLVGVPGSTFCTKVFFHIERRGVGRRASPPPLNSQWLFSRLFRKLRMRLFRKVSSSSLVDS